MAKKDVLVTQLPTLAGAQTYSLAASFFTPPTVIPYLDNCSYQINVTTSDSIGSFAVQVSDDYKASSTAPSDVISAGNWSDLVLSGVPTVASSNDVITISMNQMPFYAVRLHYTSSTPGTGTCKIFITNKAIGG